MHSGRLGPNHPLKFPYFENPRWRRPPCLKIDKLPYLSNDSTDCREIWRGDTCWTSLLFRPLKIKKFKNLKNPRLQQPRSRKIEKSPYICNGLTDRRKIWNGDAFWPSWPFPLHEISTFCKFKTVAADILKNRKIVISQQRFDRLPWNLARWHILTLLTLLTVKNSVF